MSGHSKWATIKHKKAAVDKTRGKLFSKLARQLEVAVREGGPDPETNAALRTMVLKAKAGQMTKDAIDRAIKRGSGENSGANYESITYEGYGPGGVAMLVDVLTDNRNRTASDVRLAFSKFGGSMAEPGAVSWQFARKGVVMVNAKHAEDDVMAAAIEAGAQDVVADGDAWRITTDTSAMWEVKAVLEQAKLEVLSAESTMVSSTNIPVTDVDDARKVLRIIDALEDNDDVQEVYSNFDITDEIMQEIDL